MFPPKPTMQPGAPPQEPDADDEMNGMEAQARSAPPGASKIPPQFQQFVDPNDPVQAALLDNIGKLSPQDVAAISAPPVIAALKKIAPQIGFVFDALGSHAWAGGAKPPGGPMPPPGGPPPMPRPQFGAPRPQTKLGGL